MDSLGLEILRIAFPAALALAADPIASLIDTAFIGRLGPVEIAAVGVSIAIFNQASKITIFPLVSITTSFVAEEDTIGRVSNTEEPKPGQQQQNLEKVNNNNNNNDNSAKNSSEVKDSSSKPAEDNNDHSDMLENLEKGAAAATTANNVPETKDQSIIIPEDGANNSASNNKAGLSIKKGKRNIPSASTALIIGSILGILQAIFLIFGAKPLLKIMGVKSGSPMMASALKYLTLRSLGSPAVLLSLAMQGVFRGFKDTKTPLYATGFMLLTRTVAVTICVTLAASKAARLGTTPMAAFQVCLQVWLTSSLLADGLAVAGQAILASSFAEKDYKKATMAATRVLQMGFVLGLGLAVLVGAGLYFGSGIFSSDIHVIHLIHIGVPFVAATQPINSLAFVFDGVNFGASDFAYAAYSMVLVSIASIAFLFVLFRSNGFIGIWIALTIYMLMRTFAGVWR
ncbi:hypothetical protein LWI29_035452 [Acer saccharum]|uniref:Protein DETOXIFICATION n=1 Tax=Acer saccharum TaxID=4024 RepID=A0AA39RJQ5_ACESA|nr:hypothetical protein LWI29_035452 [Acer saccharum]